MQNSVQSHGEDFTADLEIKESVLDFYKPFTIIIELND